MKISNNKTKILTLVQPLVLNKGKYLSTDIWNVFFLIISQPIIVSLKKNQTFIATFV